MKRRSGRVVAVLAGFVFALTVSAQTAPRQSPSMNVTGSFGSLPVETFTGDEALSTPFHFVFTISTDASHALVFDTTLGTEVTMTMTSGGAVRRFSGICSRVTERGSSNTRTY